MESLNSWHQVSTLFRSDLAQGVALGDCGMNRWRKLEPAMVHGLSKIGRSGCVVQLQICGSTVDQTKCVPLSVVHGVKNTRTVVCIDGACWCTDPGNN